MDLGPEKTDEVSTSSSDVYSTPIALGFEALNEVSSQCSASAVYGPSNYNDFDTSTSVMAYNKDIRDAAAVRGKCGLYNLGNTCFMNSGLQCLMSTMPLVKFLLSYYQNKRSVDETLLGQFQRLFAKIWSGQFSIVHPKEFKQTLGIYHSQFQDYRQHDCQEFLALLLDSLHEHLNFKGCSTNQLVEAGPSSEKPPITFEHNINNKPTLLSKCESSEGDNESNVTSNSSLTFDNIKDTNVSHSGNVLSNELKPDSCEKRKSGSYLAAFTVNPISEDSNHSSVSEQSSDSEHCSVMKNLKLRSSPIVSQSVDGVSPRVVNELGAKHCDVSSSDDTHVRKESVNCEEGFKRVQSLQDFRSKDGCETVLLKASSDNDLVSKASGDPDEAGDFEAMSRIGEATIHRGVKTPDFQSTPCDTFEQIASSSDISKSNANIEPVLLNNTVSTTNVPSLEDLYAKETKTLNTNVLASEYMEDSIATDSDKFSKHDNTTVRDGIVDEEDILNNITEGSPKNDGYGMPKKIKDVNIRADKKSKSPKGASGSNSMNTEKEDCFSLNSVKRMKFEGTEKNLQMQEICKIQKEVLICEALGVEKPKNVERASCVHEPSPSVESDVESDIVDDHDEMEVSDNETDDVVINSPAIVAEGACYTAAEILAAEEAWQKYLSKNDSVIVDTFQGQFKSTVVCAKCSQVSVTFEPFMYLSVPVPHAMERQLCLTVISLRSEPTKILLELHKQDRILKVKQQLCDVIGADPSNIIIAEVLDWHVSRILEDNTMLRYINDSSRKVYAFEVDQCAVGESSMIDSDLDANLADSQDSMTVHPDVFNNMATYSVSSSLNFESSNYASTSDYDGNQLAYVADSSQSDMMGTGLWEWNQGGSEKRRGSLETESGEAVTNADSTSASGYYVEADVTQSDTQVAMETINKSTVSSTLATVTDEWKSCAICLEEMPETELMVHTTCGGTFCSACLEMSAQHYRDSTYCCPVCSTPADMTEDFVPLTNAANHKPKTRIVAIPISYRCETDISGANNPFLFAHPSLLNLPSNLSGVHIYSYIQHIKPNLPNFRVLLTDGTGLKCSRCLYMEHCCGCEIPLDGEAILRPGDHLTISVPSMKEEDLVLYQRFFDHKSMEERRSDEPVTLLDCFKAFTQSEELDDHNPWFCPHCKENQRAEKKMTVWQYPDTLIIQLKRFVFHEFTSTKVDNKVMFPLDNLDLNDFISGPKTKNLIYNLYSLVCHFGGANSGHYTAYAKHPENGNWCYYNDETVSENPPGDDEYASTYVLFYQRKGTDKALQIPDDLDLACDLDGMEHASLSGVSNATFRPPDEELTIKLNVVPSTSCSQVAPSSGSCDLTESKEVNKTDQSEDAGIVDSQFVESELAEADSTGPS